jgi:hypothetical protein
MGWGAWQAQPSKDLLPDLFGEGAGDHEVVHCLHGLVAEHAPRVVL